MHTIEAVQWFPDVPIFRYPRWVREVLETGHWETTKDFTVTTPDGDEMTIEAGCWLTRDEATGVVGYELPRSIELLYEAAGVSESGARRFAVPDFMRQAYPYDYVAVAGAVCARAGVEVARAEMDGRWLVLTWQTPAGEQRSSRWDFGMMTPGSAFLLLYDEITGG